MFSTFETIQTSSDSETSDEENYESEEMKYIKQTHFLNQTSLQEYEKNRNMLYTKDILRKRLVIDSHNYFQPDGFNTSNFLVVFDFDTAEGSSLVTTNYDIYHNVIGAYDPFLLLTLDSTNHAPMVILVVYTLFYLIHHSLQINTFCPRDHSRLQEPL